LCRIKKLDLDSDEESLLVAAQAQACKYHKRFPLPPKKKSNSLFIPAIIENIAAYSLIDSSSSFSMITPEFLELDQIGQRNAYCIEQIDIK
jgi:hypothetical protein